jgi:hypothetical protein
MSIVCFTLYVKFILHFLAANHADKKQKRKSPPRRICFTPEKAFYNNGILFNVYDDISDRYGDDRTPHNDSFPVPSCICSKENDARYERP